MVNVSGDAQVPDLREDVHDFCGLLDVVFFASHGNHRVLVIWATEKGFLSDSQENGDSVHELDIRIRSESDDARGSTPCNLVIANNQRTIPLSMSKNGHD